MPIIFGWRGVTYTAGSGVFFCPHCGRRVAYRHRRIRRFFTLFFIPVIPLDLLGEFVECQQCHQSFKTQVLDHGFQQQLEGQARAEADVKARFAAAAVEAMRLVACCRDPVDDARVNAMCAVAGQVTGQPLQPAQARAMLAAFDGDENRVYRMIQDLAGELSDRGKQLLAKAAYAVASAGGPPTERERAIIARIAMVLASGQMNSILQSVLPPDQLVAIPLAGQPVPPNLPAPAPAGPAPGALPPR